MPSGGHFGPAGGGVASDASAGPDVLTGEGGRGPRGAFYRSKLGRESGTTVECLLAKWFWGGRNKNRRKAAKYQLALRCAKVCLLKLWPPRHDGAFVLVSTLLTRERQRRTFRSPSPTCLPCLRLCSLALALSMTSLPPLSFSSTLYCVFYVFAPTRK